MKSIRARLMGSSPAATLEATIREIESNERKLADAEARLDTALADYDAENAKAVEEVEELEKQVGRLKRQRAVLAKQKLAAEQEVDAAELDRRRKAQSKFRKLAAVKYDAVTAKAVEVGEHISRARAAAAEALKLMDDLAAGIDSDIVRADIEIIFGRARLLKLIAHVLRANGTVAPAAFEDVPGFEGLPFNQAGLWSSDRTPASEIFAESRTKLLAAMERQHEKELHS